MTRLTRALTALMFTVCGVVAVPAAASATPTHPVDPDPDLFTDPNTDLLTNPISLFEALKLPLLPYPAIGGTGTILLDPVFYNHLREHDVALEGSAPAVLVPDAPREIQAPLGWRHGGHTRLLPLALYYTGGPRFVNRTTGASVEFDNFYLVVHPSRWTGTLTVNGERHDHPTEIFTYSLGEFATSGGIALIGGGIELSNARVYMTTEFARIMNETLGTELQLGQRAASFSAKWRYVPL